ncbi:MAG TPA: inositol monophosphatase family protein, partial [Candidatus Lustribacter sp.]|nr:inositol monophosphatase family protein [Candidatus Lustribacter sp.]
VLTQVLPLVRDIRRLGSAALDLCLVAQGVVDAFYEDLLNPWDVAAGLLIVAEAGGIVSGWTPAEPALPAVVAGSPAIHTALCEVLNRVRGAPM